MEYVTVCGRLHKYTSDVGNAPLGLLLIVEETLDTAKHLLVVLFHSFSLEIRAGSTSRRIKPTRGNDQN